jgi:hypothetical protein
MTENNKVEGMWNVKSSPKLKQNHRICTESLRKAKEKTSGDGLPADRQLTSPSRK